MARLDGVQRPHLTVVPDSPEELRAFLEGLGVGAGRCGQDDVAPPVWRRFVVRSDLMLDELHTVVQTVMGWTDSHLHTWVSGDAMYAENAEQYEMRESIEDGFSDEDEEVCEEDVRLDGRSNDLQRQPRYVVRRAVVGTKVIHQRGVAGNPGRITAQLPGAHAVKNGRPSPGLMAEG